MPTLLYGGSFNPVHNGHLLCAREAMEQGGFSEVIFIPASNHAFKNNLIPFHHRWNMLKLAIQGERGFDVSHVEGERTGKNYTIDTVKTFKQAGFEDIHWLIGSDNVPTIKQWHCYDELCKNVKFLVVNRNGHTGITDKNLNVLSVTNRVIDISSSEIRERILKKKSIKWLVPDQVAEYIHTNRLFAEGIK
jgi:nicotinate-nucleotide adenylyltransferase